MGHLVSREGSQTPGAALKLLVQLLAQLGGYDCCQPLATTLRRPAGFNTVSQTMVQSPPAEVGEDSQLATASPALRCVLASGGKRLVGHQSDQEVGGTETGKCRQH